MSIDQTIFRHTLSHFVSGVTVVTSKAQGGEQHGMTCSAFMSISATPPCIAVCLTRGTRTERMIQATGHFAVNVLASNQAHIADRFAGRHKDNNADRFAGMAWYSGQTGAPLLQGAKAFLECKVSQAIEAADHTLFIGLALYGDAATEREPLVYYRSGFIRINKAN